MGGQRALLQLEPLAVGAAGPDLADVGREEPETPGQLELQPHHTLLVTVEHCIKPRPSRAMHFKARDIDRVTELAHLRLYAAFVAGAAGVDVQMNVGEPLADGSQHGAAWHGARTCMTSSLSASSLFAVPLARETKAAAQAFVPRPDSFEVWLGLRNEILDCEQAAVPVFSRLRSGLWPIESDAFVPRIEAALQRLLHGDWAERRYREEHGGQPRPVTPPESPEPEPRSPWRTSTGLDASVLEARRRRAEEKAKARAEEVRKRKEADKAMFARIAAVKKRGGVDVKELSAEVRKARRQAAQDKARRREEEERRRAAKDEELYRRIAERRRELTPEERLKQDRRTEEREERRRDEEDRRRRRDAVRVPFY